MNVAHLLLRGATVSEGRPAWISGERSATYAQLIERAAALAEGFAEMGLRSGDRVVLDLPNCPELIETLWGCFWGGFVAVPVNWHLHDDEVSYIVDHSSAAAILVSRATMSAAEAVAGRTRVISSDGSSGTALDAVTSTRLSPVSEVDPADPAWIFYTSGTTGRPKGAVLTHRNLLAMTLNYYADVDSVARGSVFAHAAPLSHGSGLYLLPAFGHGATNVVLASERFDVGAFLDMIESARVTHVAFLAPTMLNRVVAEVDPQNWQMTSVRSIVVGGTPFYREDVIRSRDRLGPIVTQIYGQGETPMTISVLQPEECLGTREVSCGRPFTGVDVRITDEAGRQLPRGGAGEIVVRGDVVMSGYWNDADATSEALRDGFLHTGDVGYMDELGFLYLTDRVKDVIITGGSNVYPREVEEVLLTHPAVREVAVIGERDIAWGESVCAVVVLKHGQLATEDDLIAHCKDNLASFKKPRRVVIASDLPRNATGKVLKRELRDMYAQPA